MKFLANILELDKGVCIFNYDGFTPEIDLTKQYAIEIKEYKSKRSLEANRLFWGILQKIKDETKNELMDLYVEVLQRADVKHDFLLVVPESIEALKKVFRAVKVLEYRDYNGKEMVVVKVFLGSSQFNTKEMSELINIAIQVASENGIFIDTEELI